MSSPGRGRPRASSREELADAATELFLERGYAATAIADITRRAGVSRASFFNYFASKSALLWDVFDCRVEALEAGLAGPDGSLERGLDAFANGESPAVLALAIVDARTMGLEEELSQSRAERQLRIAAALEAQLRRDGETPVRAAARGGGYAAALLAAVWGWADRGAGRHDLAAAIRDAIGEARELLG
ncbi:TetR family transcriptional regulator [Leucobacter sp. CSA2]|uniref:TetR family transcriptional regulator n=1 Tax=Leucobacter edaphi TaxID=2796472 RepID=A0A934UYA8_9MICO|nr:TetR/AcrR family transcriptional regulator [Leucobacter edaphi]MBK0422616.1 TetR family transcriptional regulator [Leucobacter edaphi]